MPIIKKLIKTLFISVIIIMIALIVALFFPQTQKYIVEQQLQPWLSHAQVDYIHITPFGITIDNLHLGYESMEIHLDHLESQLSPFALFEQRLKIDTFLLNSITIKDSAQAVKKAQKNNTKEQVSSLFYGLFPYLKSPFILAIGDLDIHAHYQSEASATIHLALSANNINEQNKNPIQLNLDIPDVVASQDIKSMKLHSTIYLQQHQNSPINAQKTQVKITLVNYQNNAQQINLELAMKQLPKPDKWASFPFDNYGTHYLAEIFHPESIQLHLKQTDSNNKALADIHFSGQYDGNEGLLSGTLDSATNKELGQFFSQQKLPKITTQLQTHFTYNTRRLYGDIDLDDQVIIEDFAHLVIPKKPLKNTPESISNRSSFLPKRLHISNQLNIQVDEHKLRLNSLLFHLKNNDKKIISIASQKRMAIDLDNLPDFLEQHTSELLLIDIKQLPLVWLNDFLAKHHISTGYLDTQIKASIDHKTLKLISSRPLALHNIHLSEKLSAKQLAAKKQTTNKSTAKKSKETNNTLVLLDKQNLNSNFNLSINKDLLNAELTQITLSQSGRTETEPKTEVVQANADIKLTLQQPLANDPIKHALSIESSGVFTIQALMNIPIINTTLKQTLAMEHHLDSTLPKQLQLHYEFMANAKAPFLTINKSHVNLSHLNKKQKRQTLFSLKNTQDIQLQQHAEALTVITNGELLSANINQFNSNWLEPIITHYSHPYQFSGMLDQLTLSLTHNASKKPQSSDNNKNTGDDFSLDINTLTLSQLQGLEHKENQKTTSLFDKLSINSKILTRYKNNTLFIRYPLLTIKENNNPLINNKGQITIHSLGTKNTPHISLQGDVNASLKQLMALPIVRPYLSQYSQYALKHEALFDAHYQLNLDHDTLMIDKADISIQHPQSNGRLLIKTHAPIALSIKKKQHNFSQNGHLSVQFKHFDLSPYEGLFAKFPMTLDYINGSFDLRQSAQQQSVVLQEPFMIKNIHYKDANNKALNPFDLTLDFSAKQIKNITKGEIKQLSIHFIEPANQASKKTSPAVLKQDSALNFQTTFQLNLDQELPLEKLNGQLDLALTQWLNQPSIMPQNTLSKGRLHTDFSLTNKVIKHQWLIHQLVDKNNNTLIKSIRIDGSGKINNASELQLELPISMQSLSGESYLSINAKTNLSNKPKSNAKKNISKKQITMGIKGKEVFLNDLLKLLAAINPQSELAQLEEEQEKADTKEAQENSTIALNKTPAKHAFWQSGIDISSHLEIEKLYYSDYMLYHHIKGDLLITDTQLKANDFSVTFHDSPMTLNSTLLFDPQKTRPYDIQFNTSLEHFSVGEFLQELNPKHVPRADGVFDVAVDIHGPLSNLSQIRNELLFDISIEGKEGVYHLIPSNDVMMRSSGAAMAVVGEVVSVLPTAGFGLGIVNRVIHFAKDINYDFISMHLVRQDDLNTTIEEFQIVSPELHFLAKGGLSFKENTRLFDQPLKMTAQMNLSGEGAAIFYGLGLLKNEQDSYGFWKGPIIDFSGTLNHQEDNFDEIITQAKEGTLAGGFTNPFSGLIGNFKYRWFNEPPDYSELYQDGHLQGASPQ